MRLTSAAPREGLMALVAFQSLSPGWRHDRGPQDWGGVCMVSLHRTKGAFSALERDGAKVPAEQRLGTLMLCRPGNRAVG